jgi:CubicO group peptidase (beta-lactamase class C family)
VAASGHATGRTPGRNRIARQRFSHTSGLTDTEQVERDPLERLPGLRQIAEPGRAFLYSNVAFACGVAAAARRVDSDQRSLIAERVLAPLGMRATHWNARFVEGSSGEILATTVRDLARLADEQLGAGRVLEAPARAEMQRAHADSFAASGVRYYGLGIDVERWHGLDLLSHGGGLRNFGSTFLLDPAARASAVLLFDAPGGHDVSAHALLDRALDRTTTPLPVRALELDWRAYLGRYANGAELLEDAGEPHLRYGPVGLQRLHAHDARVLATAPVSLAGMRTRPIGVGFLPGEPTMISVNHFPPIGARPGRRLEPRG